MEKVSYPSLRTVHLNITYSSKKKRNFKIDILKVIYIVKSLKKPQKENK